MKRNYIREVFHGWRLEEVEFRWGSQGAFQRRTEMKISNVRRASTSSTGKANGLCAGDYMFTDTFELKVYIPTLNKGTSRKT